MVDELIYVYLHIDIHIHMSQVFRVVAKKRLCEPKQHQVRTCPGAMSETVRAEIVLVWMLAIAGCHVHSRFQFSHWYMSVVPPNQPHPPPGGDVRVSFLEVGVLPLVQES